MKKLMFLLAAASLSSVAFAQQKKQFTKRPCRRECRCNGGTCG